MIKNGKKLGKRRVFSEDFKKLRVQEYESGEFTILEMGILYGISYQTIYLWIYKYSSYNKKGIKVVEMAKSSSNKLKELQKKIADLERMIGQKQIRIDYLETMIDVAKKDFDIDIKKKSDTPQS